MKRCLWIGVMSVVAGVLMAGSSAGAEVESEVGVMSAHIFRGITFNDGAVMQPRLTVTKNDLAIEVWGNFDLSDYDDRYDRYTFSEFRLDLGYTFYADESEFTLGVTEYLYGDNPDAFGRLNTREVRCEWRYELNAYFTAECGVHLDIDEIRDFYATAGLRFDCMFGSDLMLNASGSFAAVGKEMSTTDEGGLHEYSLGVRLGYRINGDTTFFIYVGRTDTLDEDVLPEQDVQDYGGAGIEMLL